MSSHLPASLRLSLGELARHGDVSRPEHDGWGLALYEGHDVRHFRGVEPAASSELVRFVSVHDHTSRLAMAHIRHATQGERALCNTQPFIRELAGYVHCFAHNGDLDEVPVPQRRGEALPTPVGSTDSERAFCSLLDAMIPLWTRAPNRRPPPLGDRVEAFTRFCERMRQLGPANFLYADGDCLFAHADRRRDAQGRVRETGLWMLERRCVEGTVRGGGARLEVHPDEQQVVLLASVPLTDELWVPLGRGEVVVVKHGRQVALPPPGAAAEETP